MTNTTNNSIIIRFEESGEQTVGEITKIVGIVRAKYIPAIIDKLNLEANPRSSKTGAVTDAIQETIAHDAELFPFMTKGILLASSRYERLERNRIMISPENPKIEGILDGGHNTLAIGSYLLRLAMEHNGLTLTKSSISWDRFKELWKENRELINDYIKEMQNDPINNKFDFLVPVELLVPRDVEDLECVTTFKKELINICDARNNNVQLNITSKANQRGYFDFIKKQIQEKNPDLYEKIEWKSNEGGDVKAQDVIALAWIPLNLIDPVIDEDGRTVEPVSPVKLYSSKGSCMNQFEKLMSSNDVTIKSDNDYTKELCNDQVESSFEIAAQLPELYDYIYANFPEMYNKAGGSYGNIKAVDVMNDKRKNKKTPFMGQQIDVVSPDGFIVPLVYGLQELMEKHTVNGKTTIHWKQEPLPFLMNNLDKIVAQYSGIISTCNYDPQKVGKSQYSYTQALNGFKMAVAGIL